MSDPKERAEKAYFHYALTQVITDCADDDEFHKRLFWALELITNELMRCELWKPEG